MEFYSYQLANGFTLVAEPMETTPAASFTLLVPAGSVTDPVGKEGIATILEGMCYRGAGPYSARELSDALDALGLQRSGGPELEYTTFGGALLREDLPSALKIYADIVRRPHLPSEHLEAVRSLALQKLRSLEDQPAQKLMNELLKTYYPGAYGRTPLGTEEGLQAVTLSDLREDHNRRYCPKGSILGVAGSFQWEELVKTIEELFGDWEGEPPPLPPPSTKGRLKYRHIEQNTAQEQIGIAYPEVPIDHPEYFDARIVVEVLSGGMSARLFTEVREKRGLVYAVFARSRVVKGDNVVICYAGTTPERSQETLEVLLHELNRLAEGVTEEEVKRAQTGLLSSLVMQEESSPSRASAITRDQFLLGRVRSLEEIREGIRRVTPQSVYHHLQNFPPSDFTIVTLGPRTLEVKE